MDVHLHLTSLIDDLLSDDPRAALIAYRRLAVDELPWLEQRVVALARREGWAWAPIARLLGRTRQSVHQRFHRAMIALRPDPSVAKHRQEATFASIADEVRRRNEEEDPIGW